MLQILILSYFFTALSKLDKKLMRYFAPLSLNDIEEEINLDTLKAYLTTKFADREQSSAEDLSDLVSQLKNSKYKTIGQVDEDLGKG